MTYNVARIIQTLNCLWETQSLVSVAKWPVWAL